MGVQVYTPNVKPQPWYIHPSRIDPRYSFVWEKPLVLYPFFENGGLITDSTGRNHVRGTIASGDNWEHGPLGIGLRKVQGTQAIVLAENDEDWQALYNEPWTIWMVCQFASLTHDESVMWSRFNTTTSRNRVFHVRTTNAAPSFLEFRHIGTTSDGQIFVGTNAIQLNTPYLMVVTSDGDTTSNNSHGYMFDIFSGEWLEWNIRGDMVGPADTPSSNPPLRMGGKDVAAGEDDMDGIIYASGINLKYWSPAVVKIMAEDVFGWMRPARPTPAFVIVAGGSTTTATPQDTFTFSDALARDFWGDRLGADIRDIFTFSDSMVADLILIRELSDTIATFTDSLNKDAIYIRTPQDTATFIDALARDLDLVRELQDTFTFSDALTDLIHLLRELQDSFTFSDDLARDQDLVRLVQDTLALIENLDRTNTGDDAATVTDHHRFKLWQNLRRWRLYKPRDQIH